MYPPEGNYPPPQGNYPPPQGGYPPQSAYAQPGQQASYGQPHPQASYGQPHAQAPFGQQSFGPPATQPGIGHPAQTVNYPPPQQAAYAPPAGGPPPGASKPPEQMPTENDTKWRDPVFAVIFYLHLIGMIILCIVAAASGKSDDEDEEDVPVTTDEDDGEDFNVWVELIVATILGAVLSIGIMKFLQDHASIMAKTCLYGSLALHAFFLISWLVTGIIVLFIIDLIFFLIHVWYVRYALTRVAFASAMIEKSVDIIKEYPAIISTSYVALFAMVVWCIIWGLGVGGAAENMGGGVVFLLVLSFYWTSEVIQNVMHVTVCGTVGTKVFQFDNMPSDPTKAAFKRAMTTSFGSICFGSLIIAIIEAVRWLLRQLRDNANDFLICIVDCILSCIESIVRFINQYAFVQVALFGKDFITAAKDTFALFEHSLIEALVNDNIVSMVITFGCLLAGFLDGGVAAVVAYARLDSAGAAVIAGIMGLLIGFFFSLLSLRVIISSISTLFVCYAMDPSAVQRMDGSFFAKLHGEASTMSEKQRSADAGQHA